MKTFLFCTAYAASPEIWDERYLPWYEHHKNIGLAVKKILLIDDCSKIKPKFLPSEDFISLCPHIGYPKTSVYGGWYRSFGHCLSYARENNYSKIIHVESDAYLFSDKIINFVNGLSLGWHSLWHHTNEFPYPESAIQVICEDQFSSFENFFSQPYEKYAGETIERLIPFTENHKNFVGDRYGEFSNSIPIGADFSCQTTPAMLKQFLHDKALVQKLPG
jgi:hypothetical protein